LQTFSPWILPERVSVKRNGKTCDGIELEDLTDDQFDIQIQRFVSGLRRKRERRLTAKAKA